MQVAAPVVVMGWENDWWSRGGDWGRRRCLGVCCLVTITDEEKERRSFRRWKGVNGTVGLGIFSAYSVCKNLGRNGGY